MKAIEKVGETTVVLSGSDLVHNLLSDAAKTIKMSRSPATIKAYLFDWRCFESFCAAHNSSPLPASTKTILAFLQHLQNAQRASSSISRALTAISRAHKLAGLPDSTKWPIVRELMGAIRRAQAGKKKRRAKPLSWAQICRIIEIYSTHPDPKTIRDLAILAIGWTGALRRSELAALDFDDIQDDPHGIVLNIRKSKTDQEGAGAGVPIPFATSGPCPIRLYRRWCRNHIDGSTKKGPVFTSFYKGGVQKAARMPPVVVNQIVKELSAAAGYDPDLYSAHSLRAGFATDAAAAGVDERNIMAHTRHRSSKTVREYIRDGRMFTTDNPLYSIYQAELG